MNEEPSSVALPWAKMMLGRSTFSPTTAGLSSTSRRGEPPTVSVSLMVSSPPMADSA